MAPELAEIHFIEPRPVERAERPFVFLNMAASLDGKIATADRRESRLGSRRDARRLLALRAAADAILCGGRTIRAENADLRLRSPPHRRWRERHRSAQPPLRIVASAEADLPPDLRLFAPGGPPLLLLTTPRAPERRLRELQRRTAAILVAPESPPGLPAALAWLRGRFGVGRLLCEGGGRLNDLLFRLGLADRLYLTLCPLLLGGRAAPTTADGIGFPRLADCPRFRLARVRQAGEELFCVFDAAAPPRSGGGKADPRRRAGGSAAQVSSEARQAPSTPPERS